MSSEYNRQGDLKEMLSVIDMEYYLDREGVDYRLTTGSSGDQLNVKTCPVCGKSKWKVFINAETGLGNCFSGSCESRFNKWSFIKAHTGIDRNGSVIRHIKHVSREMGWQPKRIVSKPVEMSSKELSIPQSVKLPYKGRSLSYLADRGITHYICKYFNLRYSRNGAFFYRRDDRVLFQSYEKRVIFPIFDIDGNLVSFQGRDVTGSAKKKYIFPPGYASTGKYLYGANNAIGSRSIIVNEGVFDVMSTKIAMDDDLNTRSVCPVGSFGKSVSKGGMNDQVGEFIKLKNEGLREVTIMWDGEANAIRAAIDTALMLKTLGLVCRVATLPKGKDPNEVDSFQIRRSYWNATLITRSSAAKMLIKL